MILDMLVEETAGSIGSLVKHENGLSVNYEMSGRDWQ